VIALRLLHSTAVRPLYLMEFCGRSDETNEFRPLAS
jgi:hypothetical protein